MTSGKKIILYCSLVLSCVALVGCGKKVDENKPTSEVKAEAEKMDLGELRSIALKYKEAITSKQAEIEKIVSQMQQFPAAKMLGEETKALKSDIDNLTKSISALKERFEIYYNRLRDKGGDVSGLKI